MVGSRGSLQRRIFGNLLTRRWNYMEIAQVFSLVAHHPCALRGQGCLLPPALGCHSDGEGDLYLLCPQQWHTYMALLGLLPLICLLPSSQLQMGKLFHIPRATSARTEVWRELELVSALPLRRVSWHSCVLAFFVLHQPCNGSSPGSRSHVLL